MTEKDLNLPDVCSIVKQMGGKRVTKAVRRELSFQTGFATGSHTHALHGPRTDRTTGITTRKEPVGARTNRMPVGSQYLEELWR